MSYPAGVLKNTSTGKFHPVCFRIHPRPSETLDANQINCRYKSVGHHTNGFVTMEEADKFIADQKDWQASGIVWEWNGTDIPAIIWQFPIQAEQAI